MDKFLHSKNHKVLLELLLEMRKAADVTQVELAERLGATQSFVSKCERGERRLDILELREWCLASGKSLADFAKALEERLSHDSRSAEKRRL